MSRYAPLAQEHWKKHRPSDYQELTDPETFFETLGDQIQEQVVNLTLDLEAQRRADLNAASDLDRIGLLNAIRNQAETTVLQDLLYGPTSHAIDQEMDQLEDDSPARLLKEAGIDPSTSLPIDPQHPVRLAYEADDPEWTNLYRQWVRSLPREVVEALPL